MKFITSTTQHVKSTHEPELIGISVKTDGIEGGEVQCIEPGGVVANAAASWLRQPCSLVDNEDNLDKSDPLSS